MKPNRLKVEIAQGDIRNKVIVDEYGTKYSMNEFRKVLSECPIRHYHAIGIEFS